MTWQSAVPDAGALSRSTARLLDALELARPLGNSATSLSALGRWIMQSGQDGTIAEDTVIWLHHLLLPVTRPPALRQRNRIAAARSAHRLAA